jgi:hypothetical protein
VAGDTGRTSVVAVGASRDLKRFQISPFVHARTRTLRFCHASSSPRASGTRSYDAAEVLAMAFRLAAEAVVRAGT